MPIFITTGKYTSDAIKGLISKPEDHSGVIDGLISAAGGKMLAFYVTSGESDFMVIAETDSADDVATAVMVAAASGVGSNFKTVQAWSSGDFAKAAAKAGQITGSYTPPGS